MRGRAFLSVLLAASAAAAVADTRLGGFTPEEREAFRQDLEQIQQQYYEQSNPELRQRWLEAVRERRQRLDKEEDQRILRLQVPGRDPRRSQNPEAAGADLPLHPQETTRATARQLRERIVN